MNTQSGPAEVVKQAAPETRPRVEDKPPDDSPTLATHCPYRQATLLQQALSPDKMRVAFFLGAGCPAAITLTEDGITKPLIPDVVGLTASVRDLLLGSEQFKSTFHSVITRLQDIEPGEPNVERVLTLVRSLRDIAGKTNHDGLSAAALDDLDAKICSVTTDIVGRELPSDATPYHHLATWISSIQRKHAVEIFTPNFDLLAEQALEERGVPYFDGFVGTKRTFFDLTSMEQDVLPARWARLWKIHGSINWWKTPKGQVERRETSAVGDRQMIFPSHLKYEQSRRMPYLAMLDRLRAFLGQGQAVLVTCGYSFTDQHLNEAILQGLSRNPYATCFGLLYGDRCKHPEALVRARRQANLNLLAADGGVVGTIERDWRSDEKLDHPLHGIAIETGDMKPRSTSPSSQCKLLLGDFKAFGDFLALQLALRDVGEGSSNAR